MVVVFLADGFEEMEALITVDVLRRAELNVCTIGIGGRTVVGSHNIAVTADLADNEWQPTDCEAVILPGGMPGTLHLEHSVLVQQTVDRAAMEGKWLCAICAAPSILGHKGLLQGRQATCFPGFEQELIGAQICADGVVCDGNIITAKGAGVALDFALCIVERLLSKEIADKLGETMQCR